MSFSYLSSGPGSSDRSWVRLRIGDTSSGDVLLQNEELDVLLADEGTKHGAAAAAARAIGAQYARKVDKQVGRLRISMAQASEHFFSLADKIEQEEVTSGSDTLNPPYAGGISLADRESDAADTDRPDYAFTRGQFDHPGT
jgi:hypothetical protein